MAQRGPPFDFDLNQPPPPEEVAGASEDSSGPVLEQAHDRLPPPPHDLPPAPASAPQPSRRDPSPAPQPSPRDLSPARVPGSSPPAPGPDSSPQDPLPAPTPEPLPHDPLHPPSPVLDLEAPLSSLDEDEDEDDDYEYDEADLPPPPPLPPFGLPVAAAPARSPSSVDAPRALPVPPNRYGERTSSRARASQEPIGGTVRLSSPENSAPRSPSRAASGTASSHRSRHRPYEPRDDAISKQRRVDYNEDAGSSRSGSRRSGSPRRYERSELASPPQYERDGGRHPAAHGQPGAPPRNRRRPQRPQHGYQQYQGPGQQQEGRGREQQQQGFRGQERPQVHQGYHGPHGPEVAKVGYSSHYPSSWSFIRLGSPDDGRRSPEQEPINGGDGGFHHQRREASPFRPSSRPRGREVPYHGRQSQAQEPPKTGGYPYQHREAPSLRPSSGAHGRDGLSGGRRSPAKQPIKGGGAYQQRKAPRGRERLPDRPYHPYARDGGAFDGTNGGGGHQARRDPQPNYEHRRDSRQQCTSGGPARGRQYYGD